LRPCPSVRHEFVRIARESQIVKKPNSLITTRQGLIYDPAVGPRLAFQQRECKRCATRKENCATQVQNVFRGQQATLVSGPEPPFRRIGRFSALSDPKFATPEGSAWGARYIFSHAADSVFSQPESSGPNRESFGNRPQGDLGDRAPRACFDVRDIEQDGLSQKNDRARAYLATTGECRQNVETRRSVEPDKGCNRHVC